MFHKIIFIRPSLPADLFFGKFFNVKIRSSSNVEILHLVDFSSVRGGI